MNYEQINQVFNVLGPVLIGLFLLLAMIFLTLAIVAVVKRKRAAGDEITKSRFSKKIVGNIILAVLLLIIAVWFIPFVWNKIQLEAWNQWADTEMPGIE